MYGLGNTVLLEKGTHRRTKSPLTMQREEVRMLKQLVVRQGERKDVIMEKPTAQDLIKALGYDRIPPVHLSPGMQKDIEQKGDVFRDWFEEELLRRYEEEEY